MSFWWATSCHHWGQIVLQAMRRLRRTQGYPIWRDIKKEIKEDKIFHAFPIYHFHWEQTESCLRTMTMPFMCLWTYGVFIHSAAAAAKSLQLCPTLCDPIDGSPPGSSVPGILQARILEWVAISFPNAWKWKVKVKSLSHAWLLATPWTGTYQAHPSMGFSRQEYWSGVPLPSPYTLYVHWNITWSSLELRAYNLWNQHTNIQRKSGCSCWDRKPNLKVTNTSPPCGFRGTFCLGLLPATGAQVLVPC